MEQIALALGLLAGLVQLAGYWQYNRIMSQDRNHVPNASSWFMWGVGGALELWLYRGLVHEQGGAFLQSKEILPLMCAVGVMLTFIHVAWRHGLRLKLRDAKVITWDLVASAIYAVTGNPYVSNVFLGIDIAISFRPILTSVKEDPLSEDPRPWLTWTIGYGLLSLAVLTSWQNWYELIYPVTCFVLHARVWRLASVAGVTAAV